MQIANNDSVGAAGQTHAQTRTARSTILLVGFFALGFLEVQGVGIVQWRIIRSGVIFDGYRLGLKMIFGVGSAVIVGHHLKHFPGQLRAIWALVGLGLWYLASSIWSVSPAMTIELSLYFLMAVVLCLAMRVSLSAADRLRALCLSFTLSALVSFFFRWNYGDFVADPGWDGAFPAVGGLGANSAIAVLLLLWGSLNRQRPFVRLVFLLGLASNVALLFLSRSDSSILTTILGVFCGYAVWLYVTFRAHALPRLKSLSFAWIIVTASAGLLFLIARPILSVSLDSFRRGNTTASGRTGIWAAALDLLQQRPVLGFGFNTYWNGPAGINAYVRASSKGVVSMHNAYVESLADAGFIALGLLIAVLVCFGLSVVRVRNPLAKAMGIALFVTTATMGMLDSYLGHVEAAQIMVLGILIGVPSKRNVEFLQRHFEVRTVSFAAVCALVPSLILLGAPTGKGPIIGPTPNLTGQWPTNGDTSVERSLKKFRRLLKDDPAFASQRKLAESDRIVEALQWQSTARPLATVPIETDLRYAREYLGIVTDLPTDLIGVLALNVRRYRVSINPRASDLLGQLAAKVIQSNDLQMRYLRGGRFHTAELMKAIAAGSDPGLCGFRELAKTVNLPIKQGTC
jgi:exopolysaccharide production protein ExoQ